MFKPKRPLSLLRYPLIIIDESDTLLHEPTTTTARSICNIASKTSTYIPPVLRSSVLFMDNHHVGLVSADGSLFHRLNSILKRNCDEVFTIKKTSTTEVALTVLLVLHQAPKAIKHDTDLRDWCPED
jgi:hypothetical protein